MSITTAEIHGVDASTGLLQIPIEHLHPAEDNPRSSLGDLTELAMSIHEHGIIEPLVVTGNGPHGWTVVAGHRRLAAAIEAGLATVPCVARAFSHTRERIEVMVVENLQRQDLDPLDEARGFQLLVDHGMTQRQIAERVGCNQSHVSRRLSLLEADAETVEALASGEVTIREAEQRVRPPKPIAEGGIVEPVDTSERDESEVVVPLDAQPGPGEAWGKSLHQDDRGRLWMVSREHDDEAGTAYTLARVEAHVVDAFRYRYEAVRAIIDQPADDEVTGADLANAVGFVNEDGDVELLPYGGDECGDDEGEDQQLVFGEPVDPSWLTTKPWGTYDGNDVARRCKLIAQLNTAERVRHVAAYEIAHEHHDEVVQACGARLVELGDPALTW